MISIESLSGVKNMNVTVEEMFYNSLKPSQKSIYNMTASEINEEYNKINNKESKLSSVQRKMVIAKYRSNKKLEEIAAKQSELNKQDDDDNK